MPIWQLLTTFERYWMRACNIDVAQENGASELAPLSFIQLILYTAQAASFFSFFFSSFDSSDARLKPFFIAALEKTILTFSSSLALLKFAWHFSQQNPTFVVPISVSVSFLTGLPVNGHATCLTWPVSSSCMFTLVSNFLGFLVKAFGQLSQQK